MSQAAGPTRSGLWLALPLGLFFAAFVVVPLILLLFVSLYSDSRMTQQGFKQYIRFLGDDFNRGVLINTLGLGLKVTALTLVLGFPLAYAYTLTPRRWQGLLMLLIILPLLTSAVVRTFAWVVILGREGIVNAGLQSLGWVDGPLRLLYTPGAVVVAVAQIELPLMVLPAITALMNSDPNLRQASLSLGAGHWRTLLLVTLPLAVPGLLTGALLVFASSVSAFVTQTLVGGGQNILMPFYMYQQAIQANDYPFAAAIAVTLLVTVMVVVTLMNLLGRRAKGFVHA